MALYYVPAPAKQSAIMRDWVVMALCRPLFPELILHWHAFGLGEWVAAGNDWPRKLTRRSLGKADLSIVLNNYNTRDAEVFAPKRIEADGVLEEGGGFGHGGKLMKALVTGGAGFIGSHLAEGLLLRGWEVIVLDNLSTGLAENLPAGARLLRGDAGDKGLLDQALPKCDAIFHLAAVSSVQDSLDRPVAVHDINLTATLVLLEAALKHGVKRFVFSSSAAVYGDTGGEPAREAMKPNPLSHYAVQKLASEYYCGVYHRLHGLETVCLRYFNIFGPRQRGDSPYSGVIAKFLEAGRQGQPALIFGDGGQTRDFCPVADVVAANIAAATRGGEGLAGGLFNVGSGHSISILQLAESMARHYPHGGKIEYREGRNAEIRHSRANISKARDILGYQLRAPFEMALKELIETAG